MVEDVNFKVKPVTFGWGWSRKFFRRKTGTFVWNWQLLGEIGISRLTPATFGWTWQVLGKTSNFWVGLLKWWSDRGLGSRCPVLYIGPPPLPRLPVSSELSFLQKPQHNRSWKLEAFTSAVSVKSWLVFKIPWNIFDSHTVNIRNAISSMRQMTFLPKC